mgnify:CR=1 FL=1
MNKYERWYDNITSRAKSKPDSNVTFEKHHIVPRSLGGTNDSTNIAWLTPREHYICHLLLVKMNTGTAKNKMWWALHKMIYASNQYQFRYVPTSRRFAQLKEAFYLRLRVPRIITQEHKNNIAEANRKRLKGTKFSDDVKQKMSISRNGQMWITNGIDSKIIKAESEMLQGWRRGRTFNRYACK